VKFARVDSRYRMLWEDPRFAEIMAKVGLPFLPSGSARTL
jgi:hypothetical protein